VLFFRGIYKQGRFGGFFYSGTPIWNDQSAPAQLPASAKHFAEMSRRAELPSQL